MKKFIVRLTIIIFVIILLGYYVNSAGGGGGSGSGGSSGGSGTGGESGGSIPEFSSVTCDDTGTITFQMNRMQEEIMVINEETNETINITGEWDRENNFESKKKIFPKPGKYSIANWRGTKRIFTCPGLHECFFIEIKDIKCIKNNSGIFSEFNIIGENILPEDLKFNYKLGKQTLSYSNTIRNTILKDLIIQQKGDRFTLILNKELDISDFEVLHETCIGKNYVYSRTECTKLGTTTVIDPESLKCGGLLDIRDRVRCRLNLENEYEEYENFFPEECRSHKNLVACVNLYKKVSECWDLPTSKERISCLKEKIELQDIKREKEFCTLAEQPMCAENLNEKILTLIKLRFYNLEEQAEILEEYGLLNKDDLVDFVIEIENKKLEFNEAKTKEEMKKIIKDVRDLWNNLIKNIKRSQENE